MARSWFVRGNGKVYGPLNDAKLKQLASESKIDASTEIALTADGPWFPAHKVGGLFSGKPAQAPPPAPPGPATVSQQPKGSWPPAGIHDQPKTLPSHLGVSPSAFAAVVGAIILVPTTLLLLFFGLRPLLKSKPRTVEGSVFVMTRDSRAEKLGLAEIRIVLEDDLRAGLQRLDAQVPENRKEAAALLAEKQKEMQEEARQAIEHVRQSFADNEDQDCLNVAKREPHSTANLAGKTRAVMDDPVIQQFLDESAILKEAEKLERSLDLLKSMRSRAEAAEVPVALFDEIETLLDAQAVALHLWSQSVRDKAMNADAKLREQDRDLQEKRRRHDLRLQELRREGVPPAAVDRFEQLLADLENSYEENRKAQSALVVVAERFAEELLGKKERWQRILDALKKLESLVDTVATAKSNRDRIPRSELDELIQSLGLVVAEGKTDGDGKFTLVVPAEFVGKKLAVLARATRRFGDVDEYHAWAILLPAKEATPGGVVLSNDNEITASSPQGLMEWSHGPL